MQHLPPNDDFVRAAFSRERTVAEYVDAVHGVGLWRSERLLLERFIAKNARLLDVGCGAGRTTFGLYDLGYRSIEGLDISAVMISEARRLSELRRLPIAWHVADITRSGLPDAAYDAAFFSFNGLELIPGADNRARALREIHRVLRPGGDFVFTTHDPERCARWGRQYWTEERERWCTGRQDPRLAEFGDLLITDEDHDVGAQFYMHVAPRQAIVDSIEGAGFRCIEDVWRPDLCEEPDAVKAFALDCRLWVVRKPGA